MKNNRRKIQIWKLLGLTLLLIALLQAPLYAKAEGGEALRQSKTASAQPRIGVVLSGGGAKGVAHIGVLRVLEKAGIPIDVITGTSMGSIVGGLYAAGWNAEMRDSVVRKQDWRFLLSDKDDYYSQQLPGRERQQTYFFSRTMTLGTNAKDVAGGLIRGKNLDILFRQLTAGYADSINFLTDLQTPFACVATDVITNTEHDMYSGSLAQAIRTSMAIPGVFSPVRKDGMILVDGGLRNNYPADIARSMGATIIIGSMVQGPPKTAADLTTGMDVLTQIVDVNCKNKYDDNVAITDIPINVDTRPYSSGSFTSTAIDTLIRRGEAAAMEHWDELVALRQRLDVLGVPRPQQRQPHAEALEAPNYTVGHTSARPAHTQLTGSVGMRFDNEEMVSLQLNGLLQSGTQPFDLEATLRLGKRIMAKTEASWTPSHFARVALAFTYRHDEVDFYKEGDKIEALEYNHYQAQLTLAGITLKNFSADLFARWDYFNYSNSLLNITTIDSQTRLLDDEHFLSYHARVTYNSEPQPLFPTRGAAFSAHYAYFTDNLTRYNGHTGFSELGGYWRTTFLVAPRLALQPMLYGRSLFGTDIPVILYNAVGGQWFGHYIEQQMPLAGTSHIEMTDRHWLCFQMQAQWQMTDNNFLLLRAMAARHGDKQRQLWQNDGHTVAGGELCYYYRTLFGPCGAVLGYNSFTHEASFFINLGFEF